MRVGEILLQHVQRRAATVPDVVTEAIAREWILPFGPGQYLYGPPWASLYGRLRELIVRRAREPLGFDEWIFPRMIPREALDSFQLSQFRSDLLIWLDPVHGAALDPVQCISLYQALRGRRLVASRLPLKVVETQGGWTWRNEAADRLEGPIRAREFGRVEHVFIGFPEQVSVIRREVLDSLVELLTRLELSWRVVAGEGCMEIPSLLEKLVAASNLDEVPVLDVEVPLDSVGNPDPRFREIGGCTVEGGHLTRRFAIRAGDSDVWSGCCGIGLNRLVVAFLHQHGFDSRGWPSFPGE